METPYPFIRHIWDGENPLPASTATSWLTHSVLDVGKNCLGPLDWEHVIYSESNTVPLAPPGGFSMELEGGRWRVRFYLCISEVGFIPEDCIHFGVASTSLQQREQGKPHKHLF